MRSHRPLSAVFAVSTAMVLALAAAPAAGEEPGPTDGSLRDARLLRFPDIHGDRIAFCYAGDIWTVPAAGGQARRLTSDEGLELFPRFSPDGRWIAFTGHYDGTSDVWVVPSDGGIPRRLTWYPSRANMERMGWDNMVIGWTPQGRILFRSQRGPIGGFVGEPYTVSPEGGPVERFPLPECGVVSFSPDGGRIAYNRIFRDFRTWKRYRGGMAQDVWIYDLQTKALEKITDWEGADAQPQWLGGSIYFLSDREDGRMNLWRYDTAARSTSRATRFREFDVKWPRAATGKVVFENGGWLYLLDPARGEPVKVAVDLPDDRKLARRRWVDVAGRITGFGLAPGGGRAVFAARGDVFTVPAENGETRNVTRTQGVREKDAVWSPDGRWIACVSDATGEEELRLVPQDGKGSQVALTSGSRSWHFAPAWSPDSKKLAWSQRDMTLSYIDLGERKPVVVDKADVAEISQYSWSPDSRWIAYTKALPNDVPAVFVYSLDLRASTRVTGWAEASSEPVFDPDGDYLYFLSDRDIAPLLGALELSFTVHRMTRPYAVTLRADHPSPFAPRSDEARLEGEKGKEQGGGKEKPKEGEPGSGPKGAEKKGPLRIDLDGIGERIAAFPVAPGEYRGLLAAHGKVLYLSSPVQALGDEGGSTSLRMFDLGERKEHTVLSGIDAYDISPDLGKLIYRAGGTFGIVEPKEGLKVGDGKLDLARLQMELDPRAEWAQVFRETWRIERDFFYLDDLGRIDWEAVRARYEPLLPFVSHRSDLTYVLGEMVAELGSGHAYVGGGDEPHPARLPVGVLGADLELDRAAGRWRIARVLRGENWNEARRSPFTEPGIVVAAGEYLLAIDGADLGPGEEPYRLLAGKAGRTVSLLVSPRPSAEGAREVAVRTIAGETDLRYRDWVEANRRKVEQATGGRVGYIHIPDMQARGLREFIRQYYPQVRKEGLVVDVRFNGGGFISQMLLERLRRVVVGMVAPRDGRPGTVPPAAFHGPMVAILNQYSASDGDLFPYFFRKYGLGPLIGKRSWGGVVGIRGIEGGLVDGGYLTVPEFAHYGMEGDWIIENRGVEPDIEVDNLPQDEMAGRDAQLERAIEEVLRRLPDRKDLPPRPRSKDLRAPGEARRL